MSVDVKDLEKLSLDELKKLEAEEAAKANGSAAASKNADKSVNTPPPEEEEEVEDPNGEEEEEVVYRREIDLGDGSGVQVFEAPTLEELVDKLAKAQFNATKKIRELNQKVSQQVREPEKRQRTADEEFVLSQEFLSKPSEAFAKLFEDTVGMPIDQFKTKLERVNAFERAQADEQASNHFVKTHPDYVANKANGERLVNYLQTFRMEVSAENLEKAYQSLKASGLLELKDASKAGESTDESEDAAANSRIANTEGERVNVVSHQRRKAASGLSARGRTAPVVNRNNGPTEKELYDMPLEKLAELANQQLKN